MCSRAVIFKTRTDVQRMILVFSKNQYSLSHMIFPKIWLTLEVKEMGLKLLQSTLLPFL